jgi:signal transduction histidine kinase
MKIFDLIKNKVLFLIIKLILTILILIYMKRYLHIGSFAFLFFVQIFAVFVLVSIFEIVYDCMKKYRFYNDFSKRMNATDKKTYIAELTVKPNFVEGDFLVEKIQEISRFANEEIAFYHHRAEDYQSYIETWVHEIKIPISCIALICENSNINEFYDINEELLKIDAYVEQTLYYAKSTDVEKDYFIKANRLDKLVKESIKKNSKQLIASGAKFDFDGLEAIVYCDKMWMIFIIGQLISNSIKYCTKDLILSFIGREENEKVLLKIRDNGCGIPLKDLPRVFDKGFIGENGRKFGKSTGIGLYLCRELSKKLGIDITIASEEDVYTEITLCFPKNSHIIINEENYNDI